MICENAAAQLAIDEMYVMPGTSAGSARFTLTSGELVNNKKNTPIKTAKNA